MRILLFVTQFWKLTGGAEKLAVQLGSDLNKSGVHTDLLCLYRDDTDETHDAVTRLKEVHGFHHIHFLGLPLNASLLDVLRGLVRLRNLLNAYEYDVVETSMVSPTLLAGLATIGTQTIHLAGIHTIYDRKLWKGSKFVALRILVRMNRRISFYAISKVAANSWVKFSGTNSERTVVIHNSVDSIFYSIENRGVIRAELGISPSTKVALFVGRLTKSKGIDVVVEGVGRLLDQYKLCLLIVGGQSEAEHRFIYNSHLIDELRDQIESSGWSDRILFLGHRHDVAQIMVECDLLVHPTLLEGFGLVLAEALAVGLPIVATNIDAVPEVLNNSGALLVKPNDVVAFQNAVEKVLRLSDHEVAVLRSKAKQRASEFTTEARTAKMLDLLRTLLYNDEIDLA